MARLDTSDKYDEVRGAMVDIFDRNYRCHGYRRLHASLSDRSLRIDAAGIGTLSVTWSADVVIDGYGMRYEKSSGLTTLSPGGAVQIESFGCNHIELVPTAPNAQSMQFSDARINLRLDPSTGNVSFGGVNGRTRALSIGNLGVKLRPSDLRVTVATVSPCGASGHR